MGTKNNPAPNDCHLRALPDEETFTLLARDASAPKAIRYWALERIKTSKNLHNDPIVVEARECADRMDAQRDLIRDVIAASKNVE